MHIGRGCGQRRHRRRPDEITPSDGRTVGRSVGRARNPADLPIRIFKCTIGYISARSRIFAVAYLIRYTEVGLASTRAVKVRRRRRLSPSPEPVRVGPPPPRLSRYEGADKPSLFTNRSNIETENESVPAKYEKSTEMRRDAFRPPGKKLRPQSRFQDFQCGTGSAKKQQTIRRWSHRFQHRIYHRFYLEEKNKLDFIARSNDSSKKLRKKWPMKIGRVFIREAEARLLSISL